jgi:hypothetical protein
MGIVLALDWIEWNEFGRTDTNKMYVVKLLDKYISISETVSQLPLPCSHSFHPFLLATSKVNVPPVGTRNSQLPDTSWQVRERSTGTDTNYTEARK